MDRQLLARATDSSDAPTPGYLYLDIAKNAASSPTACQEIATYLIRKFEQKSNYNIKHKCCKVMAQLAVSPITRGQFKRCLAQDANAVSVIKEHLQFRGPPDPARGDEIYERVRLAAKEALDAIYSDTPPPTTTTSSVASSSHYDSHASPYGGTGMSTSSHNGMGSSAGGGGPRRMEGIGNPMFADPRLTQRPHNATSGTILKEVMREAGQTIVGMIKDPLARNADPRYPGNMPRPGTASSGYGGPGYGVQPPGRAELVHATGGQWTMASNRGPNSFGAPNGSSSDTSYYKAREAAATGNTNAYSWAQQQQQSSGGVGVGGSWASSSAQDYATPTITITSASVSSPGLPGRYHTPTAAPATSTPSSSGIVSDGSYERALVLELCPPGGMKAEPPPDKLASFAKAVASLNPDLVCPVLLDCLEEGQPWLIRAKALHVMDTCVQHGKKLGSDENPYANFFYACRGEIEPLAHHARSAIRDPAKRVLESLGIPVVAETTSTAFAQQQPSASQYQHQHQHQPNAPTPVAVPNLLDFDDEDDDPASRQTSVEPLPVPTAPPPASAPPPPSPDVPSSASAASLFGGLKVQVAVASAPVSGNLLGDFASTEPAATQVAATANSGGDLFGDVVVKQQAPKQETPSSIPTPMTVSTNSASTTAAAAATASSDLSSLLGDLTVSDQPTPASNGSAFGFINPPALSPTSSASSVPPKQSFDPLLNPQVPSPNSARTMMQLSQEQMKAMAYQQMIMQQQLQMAMALQHQQQHPFLVGPGGAPTHPGGGIQGGGGMPKPIMGVNAAAAVANSPFSFLENNPHAKQDDKRFDFVKDAMKHESKK